MHTICIYLLESNLQQRLNALTIPDQDQFTQERNRLMDESSKDKDDMTSKQKESEDYLNDVQIALDQNHRYRKI